MKKSILKTGILAAMIAFASCSDADENLPNDSQQSKNTKVSITDAPIDNAEVRGAFVTITDVKVNGVSVAGFSTTTVDLMTLQNGNKELLGNLDLEVGTVSNVTLVLDYENDENGDSPGSFIETTNGIKHELKASSNEISINDNTEIFATGDNEIVIDFDLRKTIIAANDGNSQDEFDFVSDFELSNGLRIVNNQEAGEISGTITDSNSSSEAIIVFAYEAGTFTDAEMQEQGASSVMFANATTSAIVSSSNSSYELNFLAEGDYELKFASFEDTDNDGEMEFMGMLSVDSGATINTENVSVGSSTNVNINIIVNGLL